MKQLLLLVSLLIVLTACAEVPSGNYYLVPAGTITPDYQHCEPEGCWAVQLITPTRTPLPTSTPVPTNTPVPTWTFTPGVSPTDTPWPTPTREVTPVLTNTPGPTVIPKTCSLRAFYSIRIRSGAGTTFPQVGNWNAGEYREFNQFSYNAGGYLWGYSPTSPAGWSVVFNEADDTYWVYGTLSSDSCKDVAGWPQHILPPEPFAAVPAEWLIHTVPGANVGEIETSYPILRAANVGYGVKPYASSDTCTRALVQGGTCIYRVPLFGSDCPVMGVSLENDPVESALKWMREYEQMAGALFAYKNTGRFWIELVNECRYGDVTDPGPVYWWAGFLETAVDYAVQHNWPPLVAPTYGPGYGDDVFTYTAWKPALLKLAAAGGMIGWHAYTPYHSAGLCACDEWLACRHRRNYQALLQAGVTLKYTLTEAARGWGNDPVDEEDFACFYQQVKLDTGLHSIAAWLGGFHPSWWQANLDGHYASLARKLVN